MRKCGRWGLAGAACAIGAVMAVAPGTAHALSCATNYLRVPLAGQDNVPIDTLLWGYSLGNTRLLGPSGEVVPLVERALIVAWYGASRGTVPILVPESDLQPDARYKIEVDWKGDYPLERSEFVTGPGPASAPPAPPALVGAEAQIGTFWASSALARWQNLQFQGVSERGQILIGDPGLGELGSITSIEGLLVDGPPSAETVAEAPVVQWVSVGDALSVGFTDCALWPDGAPDTLPARFGALDLAGNFSGWVDVPLELPSAAEAQAAADAQAAVNAADAREAESIAAANRAKIAAHSQGNGCAMAPAPGRGCGAFAALGLALGLVAVCRARR